MVARKGYANVKKKKTDFLRLKRKVAAALNAENS